MPILEHLRSRPKLWASAALVAGGLTTGAIVGSTLTAGASPATTAASSTGSTSSTGSSSSSPPAGSHTGLPKSGTVTAVGSSSVTIDGTAYAVNSSSDIDKNGEAALKDLAVGDKVTFNTVSGAATPTIDKLHAGSEALDRPTGGPTGGGPGGSGAPGYGQPPAGSSSAA